MSQIALAPPATGTGVFTIAAPATNTNRTLTLPDAAGTVISQGNILGTVSQTAGVPTGAIIERGSNANGEYVRFADGAQICNTAISFSAVANVESVATWTYPATFLTGTLPSANFIVNSISFTHEWAQTKLTSNDMAVTYAEVRFRATTTQTYGLRLSVVGRWF